MQNRHGAFKPLWLPFLGAVWIVRKESAVSSSRGCQAFDTMNLNVIQSLLLDLSGEEWTKGERK